MTILILALMFYVAMGVGTVLKNKDKLTIWKAIEIILLSPILSLFLLIPLIKGISPACKKEMSAAIKRIEQAGGKSMMLHVKFCVQVYFEIFKILIGFIPALCGLTAYSIVHKRALSQSKGVGRIRYGRKQNFRDRIINKTQIEFARAIKGAIAC